MIGIFRVTAAGLILLISVAACTPNGAAVPPVPAMQAQDLLRALQEKKAVLLICTDSDLECNDERIPGSLCLSCDGSSAKLRDILKGRDGLIVFYSRRPFLGEDCRVVQEARAMGLPGIYRLAGGMAAWKAMGYAAESPERIPRAPVLSVRPEVVAGWLKSEKAVLILDVQPPDLLARVHLPGSVNIPLSLLPDQYQDLPLDRPIVVVDEVGEGALLVGSFLKRKGFEEVSRLHGGVKAWRSYEEQGR